MKREQLVGILMGALLFFVFHITCYVVEVYAVDKLPVGYWKFDENTGMVAHDSSGNRNDGTLTTNVRWTQGKYGSAVDFDGTGNEYVIFLRPVEDDFSIMLWVKARADSPSGDQWYQGQGIFDCEVGGEVNDFGIAYLNNKAVFGVGNPAITIESITSINDGKWHHIAATRNSDTGELRLYVDGVLEASESDTTTDSRTAATYAYVGSSNGGVGNYNTINGSIDEVKVYDYVLTPGQINDDYKSIAH